MTSQDSSQRGSSDSSDDCDWFSPLLLPPANFSTNEKKKPRADGNNSTITNNSHANNHSITVVTSITNVDDPKMDVAVSAEHRQDQSSPAPLTSRTASSAQYSSQSSSAQDKWSQQLQLKQEQQKQQQQQRLGKEQIKRDNMALRNKCEELESIILQMRTEGNILQTRTALKLQNYQIEIEKATLEKQRREQQCRELEDNIWRLRTETQLRQENIWAAKAKVRKQK